MFVFDSTNIYVDPWSQVHDFNEDSMAHAIFITHEHADHFDTTALNALLSDTTDTSDTTLLVVPQVVADSIEQLDTIGEFDSLVVMNNWDTLWIKSIRVWAVPAYNLSPSDTMPPIDTTNGDTLVDGDTLVGGDTLNNGDSITDPDDVIYHEKGVGNGYVFTFGDRKVYVAGDTENIPEMDSLGEIDIAFLPMNLPYTMTPEMAADAARKVDPELLFIYHFGDSDTAMLRTLLSDEDFDIRFATDSVFYFSNSMEDTTGTDTTGTDTTTTNTLTRELDGTIFYPNPVKNYITIENQLPETSFSVFDVNGRLIIREPMETKGIYRFNLQSLQPGTYIIKN
ncbi:MAG: T9SS type A sorting domain-containing protein [Bacteroidales bacterium]|nr:T9SS type A sorting domain-containing protein [Bacteroidales bacterium]